MKTNQILIKILAMLLPLLVPSTLLAATDLADKPLFTSSSVPGNVALTLSVEFPTALGSSYTGAYNTASTFLGYFDPDKCYVYHTEADVNKHYFEPSSPAVGHACVGLWSGNFLNWALTQTIDPLRYALTGGYRRVDEIGLTVLEKAWASGQGGTVANPTISNNPALIAGATPYNFIDFKIRINGLGNKFYFTSTADNNNPGATGGVIADTAIPALPAGNRVYEMYARVKVCVPGLTGFADSKENNCTAYGANFKPTGLIQKNALKLNFAAFGYLNDGNIDRDGGVLRARMRPLGPQMSVPNSANIANPLPEWDADGIFLQNPDPVDAAFTGVANSGVINYLNKFGLTAPGYKTYDPVSELYYTAIRYYKNQGNVAAYTSNLNATMKDGFPVITNWDDPIKYSCQQNFIIGVGDTNSHRDANLPGSTIRGNEPALPPEVAADLADVPSNANPNGRGVDVRLATNRVGSIQGAGNQLGEIFTPFCCNNNTFFIAGLAYDSHTKDIRPDFDSKQTIDTYWLDVLESGFRPANSNVYYLTAKFGGFDVSAGFDPYVGAANPLAAALWDKNGDGDPDNYFRANNPALMIANLNKAFDDILKKISGSSGGFATASLSISNGSMSFSSTYNVDGWTGNVIGNTLNVTSTGIIETLAWNAVDKLETQASGLGWDTNRFIATSNCTVTNGLQACNGVPFRLANLSATQLTNLSISGASPQNMLNFLRGDRSNAGSQGLGIFRDRKKLLGDIVNSKVEAVGAPSGPYTDAFNPGYTSFKNTHSTRGTVAYVGANDGMLHAFRGTPAGGNELFAYVPNAAFAGPDNDPANSGLAALAKTSYIHRNFVDATPLIRDVYYGGGWHSLLIGGLGKGGKAYYALDVTNPSNLSNEALPNLPSAVKWEFTHQHMGYSYGKAVVVKTAKYGWVAILTSGYNNDDGKGYFFIVNPQTGTLLETISTGQGDLTNPAGLAHANVFIPDLREFVADSVYAGDLLGNVWRLDLRGNGVYPAPVKIAQLTTSSGQAQPVTVPPLIEVDSSTSKRYVLIGTGRLLADSDVTSTQEQTFYAINDGTANDLYNSSTLPSNSGGFPITRNKLIDNTTSITGVAINADPSKPMGYFIDLGFGSNGVGYRVNIPMVSGSGIVAFAANLTGGNECSPAGSNKFYALAYGTGASVLLSANNVPVKSIGGNGLAVSVSLYTQDYNSSPSGTIRYNVTNTDNDNTGGQLKTPGSGVFGAINWREVPAAD